MTYYITLLCLFLVQGQVIYKFLKLCQLNVTKPGI